MSEQSVFLEADNLKLHGMFSEARSNSTRPAAVICHPHPAYGGTMDNNVVLAVTKALQDTGHPTLRFNFRGVGRSEGNYSDGTGEVEDVRSAIRFIQSETGNSDSPVVLAGYSFGSWVAAKALIGNDSVSHLIMVAPPTSMFDLSMLTEDTKERARHFIVGDRDQFCDRDNLQEIYDRLPEPKSMTVIAGADHFLFARDRAVTDAVKQAMSDHLTD